MTRISPVIRLVIYPGRWHCRFLGSGGCSYQMCLSLVGRAWGLFPSSPHPPHLQNTPGALWSRLLSPSSVKEDIRQPPSPPPFPADWERFIHPVAFPGDEYFKILLFAILHKIYKMLSMCQCVLLMLSLFYVPGLPGLELSD